MRRFSLCLKPSWAAGERAAVVEQRQARWVSQDGSSPSALLPAILAKSGFGWESSSLCAWLLGKQGWSGAGPTLSLQFSPHHFKTSYYFKWFCDATVSAATDLVTLLCVVFTISQTPYDQVPLVWTDFLHCSLQSHLYLPHPHLQN